MRRSFSVILAAASLLAVAAPSQLLAQEPMLSADAADTLKPGEYLWHPELAADGAVAMVVDLDRQVAFVYRGDALIGITTISSGKDGKETPLGTYPILQKEVRHRSNLYGAAPMPYMQRLTWDGVALHAGVVPGYRSSHGCVHLPDAFARALYDETDIGATVAITEDGTTMADALPMTPEATLPDPDAPTLDDVEQAPAVVASAAP